MTRKADPRPPPSIPDHVLLHRIGEGAYGEVWLARNAVGTRRAVKIVYREAFADARPYEREFAGLQKFEPLSRTHEGLVDVLQIGLDEPAGYFYYVMELADGVKESEARSQESEDRPTPGTSVPSPLAPDSCLLTPDHSYLPRTLSSDLRAHGRFPFDQCLRTALSLADALAHLHRHGLIHRDIKPSNIIFVNGAPKLADIGLVTDTGAGKSWVGTEGFIPPEGPGTAQGDIFSLGKVLYEISTGKDRQRFPEPLTALVDLPDQEDWLEFNEVVAKACEEDSKKRYFSAAEMRADIALLLGGKSVRKLRRMEHLLARLKHAAAGLFLLLAGAFIIYVAIQSRAQARLLRLLGEVQTLRASAHGAGWSTQVWQLMREAARIRRTKEVRDQAAACLSGIDAHIVTNFASEASAVAFSRDGSRLLVGGGATSGARLYDLDHGPLKASSLLGFGPVAFRPDGKAWQFASNGGPGFIIRDVEQQQAVRELSFPSPSGATPQAGRSTASAVSADGALVAAAVSFGSTSRSIVVWETDSGQIVRTFSEAASCLAFSPDMTLLAAGDDRGEIRVWSVVDGREVISALDGTGDGTRSLAFAKKPLKPEPATPNQWILAVGDTADTVTLWDLSTRLPRASCHGSQNSVDALAFSPDGTLLVSGGRVEPIIWDAATGERLLRLGVGDAVTGLAFSPDGNRLAVSTRNGSYPGGVWVWKLDFGRGIHTLRNLGRSLSYVRFDSSGTKLAALSQRWRVGFWNLTNNQLLAELAAPQGITIDNAALAFSPDGREFVFSAGREARIWNLTSWQHGPPISMPRGLGDRLVYRTSGELLLFRQETWSGKSDASAESLPFTEDPRVCRIRNLLSRDPMNVLAVITNFDRALSDAQFTPDGRNVFIAGPSVPPLGTRRRIEAFDSVTGRRLWSQILSNHTAATLRWADSSGHLLINPDPGDAYVLDLQSGAVSEQFRDHPAAMSGQGDLRAELLQPHTWTLGWSLYRRGEAAPFLTLTLPLNAVSQFSTFSHDGSLFAWGNEDGTVTVCDLPEIQRRLTMLGLSW